MYIVVELLTMLGPDYPPGNDTAHSSDSVNTFFTNVICYRLFIYSLSNFSLFSVISIFFFVKRLTREHHF